VKSIYKNKRVVQFLEKHFPDSPISVWTDWKWHLQNSIHQIHYLSKFLILSDEEKSAFELSGFHLPFLISPYYLSLLCQKNDTPLRKTVIPVQSELIKTTIEKNDPLDEKLYSPVPNLVHRYPDRVLFLATDTCATYCRYCTRSHIVAKHTVHASNAEWKPAFDYIKNNPQIHDVLISGGDPLMMSDDKIDFLLSEIRKIKHIQLVRMGTKVPAVLPQRITKELVKILKKYQPFFMSLHFTHFDEITEESSFACKMLADAGIPLGSQTVLLKGVNDDILEMTKLMKALLTHRVKPYYLYQCDPIPGSSHFRTTVQKGLEIIEGMRGHITGYAIPHYVIDAPGGGGKIPLLPDYTTIHEDGSVTLRNYEEKIFKYPV